MATDKKKIEKRWRITRWEFDHKTRELIATMVARTKPMTERRARALAMDETLGHCCCWKVERYYR